MATVKFSGQEPTNFYNKSKAELVAIVNQEAANLETALVEATPGDRGGLRQGWVFKPATESKLQAIVGQSKVYFLPLELGRKPGKGVSAKGQQELAKWSIRKGITGDPKEAKSFAFLVSRKYKREGKTALGFAGLATEGAQASSVNLDEIKPVGGPILEGFKKLTERLK